VNHQEIEAFDALLYHLGKPVPQIPSVGVAPDGRDRRDGFQFGKQIGRPDIAGVDDVVNLLENLENFRTKQAVSIGDDSKPHGVP
jgi:hypothetical protein